MCVCVCVCVREREREREVRERESMHVCGEYPLNCTANAIEYLTLSPSLSLSSVIPLPPISPEAHGMGRERQRDRESQRQQALVRN